MARLVYACRFDVAAAAGISEVLSTYRDWIGAHYREKEKLTGFDFDPSTDGVVENLPNDHALSSSIFRVDEDWAVRIKWSSPAANDDGLRWLNEVRTGQFGERCGVEHLISVESVEYNISPTRLLFGSPRAVRDICTKTTAFIGMMQVRATPYPLKQAGVADLLTLLQSDLRKLPVVLLSPYAQGDRNSIDAAKLARNLAGVAVVVAIDDPDLTWDFANEVGRQLSCFNGAARIYWPGFTKNSDARSHRLYLGAWIDQVGPDLAASTIERTIFAVAAFRYVPDRRIIELVRKVESSERQKLLVEKKAAGDDFWHDYERDLARLEEAEERIADLEAENANLRANQEVLFASGPAAPGEPGEVADTLDPSFSTVAEAATAAAKKCKNLLMLESAITAAQDSPFQRPYDVYRALVDLDEIVDAWRRSLEEKGKGGDLLQLLRERGWGKRSSLRISDTARGKFRADYEFEYRGKRQLFEPHITIGSGDPNSCASIHFLFDQDVLKMVVAHIGRHLPNTKT